MAADTPEKLRTVLDFVRFRIATGVGAVLAVLALFLSTMGTWFSENPQVLDPPAALVSRWDLWSILVNGTGDIGVAGATGLAPVTTIDITGIPQFAGRETNLGFAVLVCLLLTMIALVVTAVRASWTAALAVAIGATATFVCEAVLRAVGDGEHGGSNGVALYFSGNGLALAQWLSAAVVVWAVCVLVVARRDWRVRADGMLTALADAR